LQAWWRGFERVLPMTRGLMLSYAPFGWQAWPDEPPRRAPSFHPLPVRLSPVCAPPAPLHP